MSDSKPSAAALPAALASAAAVLSLYAIQRHLRSSEKSSDDPKGVGSCSKAAYLLAGDIGGTNSRLSLYDPTDESGCAAGGKAKPLHTKTYLNSEALKHGDGVDTFSMDIVLPFLNECFRGDVAGLEIRPTIVACFACAGPVDVRTNKVTMTNIGGHEVLDSGEATKVLVVCGPSIERATVGHLKCVTRAKIVNDFVGQGYGALDLDLDSEVRELVPGSKAKIDPLGPKVCVGAGTGLGECYLTTSYLNPNSGYECYPSEGGHVEFAPRNELEIELLEHLKKKFKQNHRISVERVVSGKGLANVYEFLAKKFPKRVDKAVHDEFVKAGDMQGKVVGMNAAKKGNLCHLAMDIMIGAYGSEVGSAALKFIPTGGLYVTGGLTPKNIGFIEGKSSSFLRAFFDKGRVSPLLNTVPLFAVMEEDIGLRGARVCAMREYNNLK